MKDIRTYIDDDIHNVLKIVAWNRGIHLSSVYEEALYEYAKRHEDEIIKVAKVKRPVPTPRVKG